MPAAPACPDPATLSRLMLGQIAGPEGEQLARHLEACDRCAAALRTLQIDDTLIEAARSRRGQEAGPEGSAIRDLIERLARLRPQAALPAGDATEALTSTEQTPTPRGAAGPETFGFLSPPQGPGELGRLGDYRVLKLLGQGGMGFVFQAEDMHLQRQVALKVMKPEAANRAGARERFLREARAAAALEHDHIVTIYRVGEERGVPYLAMQWLKGMSLEERLQRPGALSISQVLRLGQQIARGLHAAHERGLVHRDVKPANLWIEPEHGGRIRILDFGLARTVADEVHLTQSGMIIGTPLYMAPEQARGGKVDARSDLFSLGIVLYRMCTGRLPFRGDSTMAILSALALDTPQALRQLNATVPPELDELVIQLLAKDPAARPVSARAVAERLQWIERQPASARGAGELPAPRVAVRLAQPVASEADTRLLEETRERPAKSAPRRRWLLAVAVAAALVGSAATAIVMVVRTGEGTVEIVTDDPKVKVTVEGDGVFRVIDPEKELTVRLKAGKFRVRLGEGAGGLELVSSDEFTLERNGKTTVTIRRVKDAPEVKPVADNERKAAEWVLSIGGTVSIRTADKDQEIAAARDLPGGPFQVFAVSLNRNVRVTDAGLANLKPLTNLRTLELGYTHVTDAGLAHLKTLTGLQYLSLVWTPVGDAGLAHLETLPNLSLLYLGGTKVGDTGLRHLEKQTNRERFDHLDLSDTLVSNAGLAHLKPLTSLTYLWLGNTQVTDAGLEQLKPLTNLQLLYLNGTKVGNTGLAQLSGLTGLRELGLGSTQVGENGLPHLKTLTNLTTLDLSDTKVTAAGVKGLRRALPKCEIRTSPDPE
jgi:hypothetical protein